MSARVFGNAGAQSTVASTITAVQTSVTLASAGGFPAIPTGNVLDVIIMDSGAVGFNANNPLNSNYEYQPGSSLVGNVLTFGGGVRAAYAGTTPKAYSANATVAAVILGEGLRTLQGNLHGISVWQSVGQAINSGAFVNMPFDQVESDPEGRWDNVNRRYTCAAAGIIVVTLGWVHNGSACRVLVSVGKNSTAEYARVGTGGNSAVEAFGSRRLVVAANDQIYPLVWQNSGAQVNNLTGLANTFFSVQWEGEL